MIARSGDDEHGGVGLAEIVFGEHVTGTAREPGVESEARGEEKGQGEQRVESAARSRRPKGRRAQKSIEKKVDLEGEGDPNQNVVEENRRLIEAEEFIERGRTRGEAKLREAQQNEQGEQTKEMENTQTTSEVHAGERH